VTFTQIRSRVLSRTNQSSATAQTRVGEFINERYRALVTSINMGRVRGGSVSVNTVAATATITPAVIKPRTLRIESLNRILTELTLDQIRNIDASNTLSGAPDSYAVIAYTATGCTIQLLPVPDDAYAIKIDGLVAGTDLSGVDVPAFPEDFHDILVFGALADEMDHLGRPDEAAKAEAKMNRRTGELRYFIAKSNYLHRVQGDNLWQGSWWWNFYGRPFVT
jgi:hypothetical protein